MGSERVYPSFAGLDALLSQLGITGSGKDSFVNAIAGLIKQQPGKSMDRKQDGAGSPYARPATLGGLEEFVPNLRLPRVPSQTHWLHEENPELVNVLIRDFLAER